MINSQHGPFGAGALVLCFLTAASIGCSGRCSKPSPQSAALGKSKKRAEQRKRCKAARAAVQAEVDHAISCKVDSDCRIVPLEICSIWPRSCGFEAINPARAEGLYLALADFRNASCSRTGCTCRWRFDWVRCRKNRCVGGPGRVAMGIGKAAGLEGTFVTPTLNVHWILRVSAKGTFTWSMWSHFGGREGEERTRGTWRATGQARLALKVTHSAFGSRPPAALTVVHAGGKRALVDDAYVRERRRSPPGNRGEIFVERKEGDTGVPHLWLIGRNHEAFRDLVRSLKIPR